MKSKICIFHLVSRRSNIKLPGSTLSNEQRKIHKLHRYGFGKKLCQSHLIDSEKKHAVNQLLNLNRNMENLDKEIVEIRIELRWMRKQKMNYKVN